ncbi:hypothetical protein NPIL_493331 [Nephila pilipes]|uniref:Uncharacterized protein n=1 Tax=Nephila pilipes TaxID=299642 RepID=A0A8X6QSQ4_NEPPI|nr:hypothetical protein NPIL_493331 [Nephila pilipes]
MSCFTGCVPYDPGIGNYFAEAEQAERKGCRTVVEKLSCFAGCTRRRSRVGDCLQAEQVRRVGKSKLIVFSCYSLVLVFPKP